MNCPTCGGPLRLEEDKDYLICDFCKSMHFPEPDADGVRILGEPAQQSCPVCGIPLVHAAIGGLRILYCGRCRGMLIPMDAFLVVAEELRARQRAPCGLPHALDLRELERRIHCPRCGRAMDTHPYAGPGNIVIDSCSECQVDWLDYGELMRIVRAPYHKFAGDDTLA
jgi:Zn-finger nucleic acid-binding protein